MSEADLLNQEIDELEEEIRKLMKGCGCYTMVCREWHTTSSLPVTVCECGHLRECHDERNRLLDYLGLAELN